MKFQQKKLRTEGKFLKLKMQQFLGPQTTGLQSNVSGKKNKKPKFVKTTRNFCIEID